MKKILTGLCALSFLAIASCKKDSDSGNSNTSKGTWKVGTTTYTAKSVNSSASGGTYELIALSDSTASGEAMLTFYFGSGKPVTGNYPVDTGANSVSVSCSSYSTGGTEVYNSGAATGVNAAVTVSGNTVKISVPSVAVQSIFSGNSAQFSASSITL